MRPPSDAAYVLTESPEHNPSFVERHSELQAVVGISRGRPELLSRYHTSPLKIAKTFRVNAAGQEPLLAIVQMDGSPGLLEGDRYTFDWEARENVRLYVTNQAYTRVHPCEAGDSRVRQRLKLGPGAIVEWMPEPFMLFKDARFVAETDISLSAGSVCFYGEVFSPGRVSRGEAFAFSRYDGKLAVRRDGELIHYQRQIWEPVGMPIADAGCFGGCTHVGTFYAFSDRITAETAENVREKLESSAADLPGDLTWGVARTARHGMAVQAAGTAAWKLQKLIFAAWGATREVLLNEPPLRLMNV